MRTGEGRPRLMQLVEANRERPDQDSQKCYLERQGSYHENYVDSELVHRLAVLDSSHVDIMPLAVTNLVTSTVSLNFVECVYSTSTVQCGRISPAAER